MLEQDGIAAFDIHVMNYLNNELVSMWQSKNTWKRPNKCAVGKNSVVFFDELRRSRGQIPIRFEDELAPSLKYILVQWFELSHLEGRTFLRTYLGSGFIFVL
jgi:hypothetical protein